MGTKHRPAGPSEAVYTNEDALLCLLLDLKAAFDLVDDRIRRFSIADDETKILMRTLRLRQNLAWEIDQRDRTRQAPADRPLLHLVQ